MKRLSRQRRYQLRHHLAGLCYLCAERAATAGLCLKHAKANRERQRAAKGYCDRYRSLTYRLGRDMNLAGKTRQEIAEGNAE